MGSLHQLPRLRMDCDVGKEFRTRTAYELAAHTLENGFLMGIHPWKTPGHGHTSFHLVTKVTQVTYVRDATGLVMTLHFDLTCHHVNQDRWLFFIPCYWTSNTQKFTMDRIVYSGAEDLLALYADEMALSLESLTENYAKPFLNGMIRHVSDGIASVTRQLGTQVVLPDAKDMFPEEPPEVEWSVLD